MACLQSNTGRLCLQVPWEAEGGDAGNGNGRRRLAALLCPIMWRMDKRSAARDHPLPERKLQVGSSRVLSPRLWQVLGLPGHQLGSPCWRRSA